MHDINKCDNFYISVFKDFNIPEDLFGELFAEGINNQVYTQPKTIRKTLMHSHSSWPTYQNLQQKKCEIVTTQAVCKLPALSKSKFCQTPSSLQKLQQLLGLP